LPGPEGLLLILGDLPVPRHKAPDAVTYVNTAELSGADVFIIDTADPRACAAALARFPNARTEIWQPHLNVGPALRLIFVGEPPANSTSSEKP
jgi:hypothetical protein